MRPIGAAPSSYRRLFISPMEIITHGLLANMRWCRAQWSRVQPWRQFLDPAKISLPRSARELKLRMRTNGSYFSRNYVLVFIIFLTYHMIASPALLMRAVLTAGVAVALKIHADVEVVALRGTNVVVSTSLRSIIAAAVALYVVCAMGSVLAWSFVKSFAASSFHAVFFTRPPSPRPRAGTNRRRYRQR